MSDTLHSKLHGLYQAEIQDQIKSKGDRGMDYVPWSVIMNILARECPDMTYKFHEFEATITTADGNTVVTKMPYMRGLDTSSGVWVKTSITIDGVTREMTSPVYGRTFTKVNPNPNAKDIHDAQMRCLCKNAAMFGLGVQLWTREEDEQMKAQSIVEDAKEIFNGTVVEQPECPKCKAPMVERDGKYGPFWACTAYPNCKTTIPIKK